MSSQQSEDHTNRSRDQSNNNHPTATAMGYSAPSGQMVYPYPPPHGYNQYPYAQAPPVGGGGGAYYTTGQGVCSGFGRGIVIAFVFVIFLTFLSSVMTWAILHPQVPVFELQKMIVSNFSTDKSSAFTGNWDANLNVQNTNHRLRLYLDKIVATMYYDQQDSLASTWVQSVLMETQANFSLNVNVSTNGSAEEEVPIWLTQQMSKDREKGSVAFALRVRIVATFEYDYWWSRSLVMTVSCERLKIVFKGDSRNGALAPESDGYCEVYA